MNLFLLSISTENYTLGQGAVVAVTGILTVLFILALISLCITISAKIIYGFEHKGEKTVLRKKKKAAPEPIRAAAPVSDAPAPAAAVTEQTDDKELVAVISAAIAASLNVSADKLVVRSFRRSSNWQKEALNEQRQQNTIIQI